MKLDLNNNLELNKAKVRFDYLIGKKSLIELKEIRPTRSSLQNRALHKFFLIISEELNDLGMEFQYFGLKGKVLSTRYTEIIVKEQFWKPIQRTLFDIESTKDINTTQINEIVDVVAKFFAEKGLYVEFPNKEMLNEV